MASSSFGAKRTLVGKAYRSGVLGDALTDVYKDVDEAFATLEAGLGVPTVYDANSILKADTDNTPVVLAVPEQRLLGRITGGTIAALTAVQIRTLLSIDNVENGAQVCSAANVTTAGAVMDSELLSKVVTLTADNVATVITVAGLAGLTGKAAWGATEQNDGKPVFVTPKTSLVAEGGATIFLLSAVVAPDGANAKITLTFSGIPAAGTKVHVMVDGR